MFVLLGVGAVILLLVVVAGFGALFAVRSAPPVAPVVVKPVVPAATTATPTAKASAAPELAKLVKSMGSAGTGPGQLDDARSLAVDLDENVYVADYSDGRVQKLDKDGKFAWIASLSKNSFSGDLNVFGLACDTKGTLWVNRRGDLVKLSTKDGSTLATIKGDYDHTWFEYIAIAPTGEMISLHSAAGDTDFLRLDANAKVTSRVKNKDAAGLAIDGKKNAYLIERFPDAIEVLDEKNGVVAKFGSKDDLSSPDAIAVDGNGHVFVAMSGGVAIFDARGKLLGKIKTAYGRAIAISNSGKLFVLSNKSSIDVYELGKID